MARITVTAGELLDILQRATSVIEESEGADEHGELLSELRDVSELLTTEIGASHMGTFADDVLIERGFENGQVNMKERT